MGAVKQALIEVEDLVCGCLQQHRTLNQRLEICERSIIKKENLILIY